MYKQKLKKIIIVDCVSFKDFQKKIEMNYCGIIIVRRGPMLVVFAGNPYPQIHITINLYTIICLKFIIITLITPPTK